MLVDERSEIGRARDELSLGMEQSNEANCR